MLSLVGLLRRHGATEDGSEKEETEAYLCLDKLKDDQDLIEWVRGVGVTELGSRTARRWQAFLEKLTAERRKQVHRRNRREKGRQVDDAEAESSIATIWDEAALDRRKFVATLMAQEDKDREVLLRTLEDGPPKTALERQRLHRARERFARALEAAGLREARKRTK